MQMHMERADDDEHVRRIGGTGTGGNAVVGDCATFDTVEDTANASAKLRFELIIEAIATNAGAAQFVRLRERRRFVMVLRKRKWMSEARQRGGRLGEVSGFCARKTSKRIDRTNARTRGGRG